MNVQLKGVTRENWEVVLKLKVRENQDGFVPSVAVSLAKIYIKPDGENVIYIPFSIYDQEKLIGFIMHAYEENTTNMYWINGFIIDENFQGKGYGRAALTEMVKWIAQRHTQCREIRLTVHKNNQSARALYESFGFVPAGYAFGDEDVMFLTVK